MSPPNGKTAGARDSLAQIPEVDSHNLMPGGSALLAAGNGLCGPELQIDRRSRRPRRVIPVVASELHLIDTSNRGSTGLIQAPSVCWRVAMRFTADQTAGSFDR
jgi:hypothetical protein